MLHGPDAVAYPEMVSLLMENSEQCCSIFKVLGSIQVVMSSRQLDMSFVGKRETLEITIIWMVSKVMGWPRYPRQSIMEKMGPRTRPRC